MNPWQFSGLTRLGSPSSDLENLRRWLSCETTRSLLKIARNGWRNQRNGEGAMNRETSLARHLFCSIRALQPLRGGEKARRDVLLDRLRAQERDVYSTWNLDTANLRNSTAQGGR
jgi:hypothetical protein